jgi:hypothetical protein
MRALDTPIARLLMARVVHTSPLTMNGLVLSLSLLLTRPAAADTSIYIENVIWPQAWHAYTDKSVNEPDPKAGLRLAPAQRSRGAARP